MKKIVKFYDEHKTEVLSAAISFTTILLVSSYTYKKGKGYMADDVVIERRSDGEFTCHMRTMNGKQYYTTSFTLA